jgi:hypothetical protein
MTIQQSKLEYRIVNVVARSIFSERHLTQESAEARLAEFRDYGIGTENLEVFITAPPESQWLRDKSQECQQ